MRANLIGPAFETQTPESFHAYVTGLYQAPDVIPDAKAARGIRITKTKRGITVRCTRDEKQMTEAEVTALAQEYGFERQELLEALTKRKFKVTNQEGTVTNAKPKGRRGSRGRSTEAQRDAHLDSNRRQAAGEDQLFVAATATDVPQEIPVQLSDETQGT